MQLKKKTHSPTHSQTHTHIHQFDKNTNWFSFLSLSLSSSIPGLEIQRQIVDVYFTVNGGLLVVVLGLPWTILGTFQQKNLCNILGP